MLIQVKQFWKAVVEVTINGISEKVQQIKFDVEIRIMIVTALSQEVSGKVRRYFDFQDLVMEPNDIIYESSHDFEIFVTKAIHAKAGELTGVIKTKALASY